MLILASGSPQRRAILSGLGIEFEVHVSDVAELEAGPPEEVVAENAFRKARAVADRLGERSGGHSEHPVLGVDTAVALGGKLYGKPADQDAAAQTLRALAANTHRVLSGLCLIDGERVRNAVAVTAVEFRAIDQQMLDWYLDTGEWQGRAGGYAIQGRGAALVRRIEGDYLNVVGLPLSALLELAPGLIWGAQS